MARPAPRCRFYLLTPPAIDLPAFGETLKAALDAGDVAALQLRLKPAAGRRRSCAPPRRCFPSPRIAASPSY